MQSLICREFEEFVEALPGLQGHYVITHAQSRDWKLQVIDLGGICFMLGHEGAGRIYNGMGQADCYHVYFVLDGRGKVAVDGREFDLDRVAWIAPKNTFHTCTQEPISWLNVAIDARLLQGWLASHEDELPQQYLVRNVIKPACTPPVQLLSLVERLLRSEVTLQDSARLKAARSAALETTMRAVLPLGNGDEGEAARCVNRMRIIDRALQRLNCLADEPAGIAGLCEASGTSERTLRNAFHSYYGIGPQRYLMLHRLHAIRHEIRRARPSESVTSLCSRYGIWDFGRFAHAYRMHFGTLPSQDLYGGTRWPLAASRRAGARK